MVLLASIVLAGLLPPASGQSLPASQPTAGPAFRFAAITDTHIAQPAELARFRRFLCTIQDLKVDFLLMLGDVCGHAPEYLPQVREVIEHSGLKVYTIPGNHDDNYGKNPEWYDTAFAATHYSFEHKGWHFVMSNSQVPAPATWLGKQLAVAGDRPIVHCQHYPPTPKQIVNDQPWAELAQHPNVRLVLFGHEHRRDTRQIGPVRYEVMAKCFFTGGTDAGHYYILDAYAGGRTQIQEFNLADLQLHEPADQVPVITVGQPHDGDILRNGTTFAGAATDDKAVKRVEYSVDWGTWQPAEGTRSWKFR